MNIFVLFLFFGAYIGVMTAITREILKTILDKKLDNLKRKLDSLIESIGFFDAKPGELNRRVDVTVEIKS